MNGYFHTDGTNLDLVTLAEAVTRADAEGKSFRIHVENGIMKYKVGGGSWSPPMRSTFDPFRDSPLDWEDETDTELRPVRLLPGLDGSPIVNDGFGDSL